MKLIFALCVISLSAAATTESSHRIGVGGGTPFVAEAMYEYWGGETPLVFRAHGGTIGIASSAGVDFGLSFGGPGNFRQFVGLSGEAAASLWYQGLGSIAYGCAGPKYGMRYKGLYADVGVGIGGGSGEFLGFPTALLVSVFPMLHAGYAFEL